jgi:hypothetical protein
VAWGIQEGRNVMVWDPKRIPTPPPIGIFHS